LRDAVTKKVALLIINLTCTAYGVHVLFDLNWVHTAGFYIVSIGFSAWLLEMNLIKK